VKVKNHLDATKYAVLLPQHVSGIARAEPDDPCAETRFRLSEKRTSPFESAGVLAQSAGRMLC
jgi:hypothetical protein